MNRPIPRYIVIAYANHVLDSFAVNYLLNQDVDNTVSGVGHYVWPDLAQAARDLVLEEFRQSGTASQCKRIRAVVQEDGAESRVILQVTF